MEQEDVFVNDVKRGLAKLKKCANKLEQKACFAQASATSAKNINGTQRIALRIK